MANVPMIFVSSTKSDLQREREAILAVLNRLKLPHNSMESFGADMQQPLDTCLSEVSNCDVLVMVIGHRYGSVINHVGVSFTEAEYRRAWDSTPKKLIFAYIRDNSVPVLPEHVEKTDDGNKRLEEFKKVLLDRHTVSFFRSELDLAVQMAIDLKGVAEAWEETVSRPPPHTCASVASHKPESFDSNRSNIIATCVRYGKAWQGLEKTVQESGLEYQVIDKKISKEKLREIGVLILPGSGHCRNIQLSNDEIDATVDFVASGGGLLCAAQAWSWVYKKYGNKPIEMFPLNALGNVLGFRITGKNIGTPDPKTTVREVFGIVKKWMGRQRWAPSMVEADSEQWKISLKDLEGRPMAIHTKFQAGCLVVVGHEAMLQHNPNAFREVLKFLIPKTQRQQEASILN